MGSVGLATSGAMGMAAVSVDANGASAVTIEGNTFDASEGLEVSASDSATVSIVGNLLNDDTLVDVSMTADDEVQPALFLTGSSMSPQKVVQGNHIYKSRITLDHTDNWSIGGTGPGEGNILIGERAGVYVEQGNSVHIAGNYIHIPGDLDGWNQVKALSLIDVGAVVVEHNVIRDGNWLVDVRGNAEVRYNLLGDSHDRPWLILEDASTQSVHHNVFIRTDPTFETDGVEVNHPVGMSPAEIYNNTFAGGGTCWAATGPALVVNPGAFLASFRSNAVFGFVPRLGAQTALVRGAHDGDNVASAEPINPPPQRLGYADYNLFYNPNGAARVNYGLAVAGKRERLDPGFALNDAVAGGKVDDQVAPKLAGDAKMPVKFTFDDTEIKAARTTVCQILAFYRTLYAPAAGSPLVGTGDPADGAQNNIGAIGGADDHFGKLCADGDIGKPILTADVFTCPPVSHTGGGSTGGANGGSPTGGKGFVCVCEAAAAPTPASMLGMLFLVGAIVRRRRAR